MRQPAEVPSIDVRDAASRLGLDGSGTLTDRPKPLLVDVRERDEFAALRVPGVALVPLSEFAARSGELPRDRPLLVMCAVGGRSARVTEHLLASGFSDVHNVAGGIMAWQAAGLPVLGGPPAPDEGQLTTGI